MGSATPETVFLDVPRVLISNTRAVLDDVTYAMAQITSVRTIRVEANPTIPFLVALAGFFVVVAGIKGSTPAVWLAGGAVVALAAWMGSRLKPTFVMVLFSAGGETHAYGTYHEKNAQIIVDAISQAIIARG